jgi:hypothetical protein
MAATAAEVAVAAVWQMLVIAAAVEMHGIARAMCCGMGSVWGLLLLVLGLVGLLRD